MIDLERTPTPGSVEWWLRRLNARLDRRLGLSTLRLPSGSLGRTESIDRWEAYYRGRLNLMLSSAKWRQEFADRFPGYSANFMALVVDKHRERLAVQGIRYADNVDADRDAWSWWQDNHLDAESTKLYREVLVKGQAYQLVWPNADGIPEVSIESPNEVIVETAPGKSWQRLAALKRWVDADDGFAHAELYLPDALYKFRSRQSALDFSSRAWIRFAAWERFQPRDEDWPVPIKIGVVPIVPFVNRPDLLGEGESEIAPVASNQDAINKFRVDAIIASEFASFRQRWAIGLDIPIDPETGLPVESFKASVDRLWIVPPPDPEDVAAANGTLPDVKFGEFDVTPLTPFYDAIRGEVQMLGAESRTPYHYLLPQSGQPPSGDSLRAAEAGLVAKVEDSQLNLGEGHEEVFRLNFLWRGDKRGQITDSEVIWKPAETQSEAQHVDALGKLVQTLGLPQEWAWEQLPGMTPQAIRRIRRMKAAAELEAAGDASPSPRPSSAGPSVPIIAAGATAGTP